MELHKLHSTTSLKQMVNTLTQNTPSHAQSLAIKSEKFRVLILSTRLMLMFSQPFIQFYLQILILAVLPVLMLRWKK